MLNRVLCRIGLLLALVSALVSAPLSSGSASHGGKDVLNILIVNSYYAGFLWADEQLQGLKDGLEESGLPVALTIEYMDVVRQKPPFDSAFFADYLRWRVGDQSFDLIITTDNAALEFVAQKYEELFWQTPVVFSDADGIEQIPFPHGMKFTGVTELKDFGATIGSARELFPKSQRIVVFGNTRDVGGGPSWALRYFQQSESDLPVEIHLDKSYEEFLAIASRLEPTDILFNLAVAYDSHGVLHEYGDVRKSAAAVSPAPSFAFWGTGVIEGGAIGGLINTPYDQGRAAAEIAADVLRGTDPSAIPIQPARLVNLFDYPSLERFGLDTDDLPENSTVLHKPYSIYEDYEGLIWTTAGVVVGLLFLVFVLLVNIRKRQAAETALAASRDHLEEEVTARTAELRSTNQSLSETLGRLERTQEQLIESEKMASLGGLVSGVAHEINTPLGVSLTAASHFQESARELQAAYERDELSEDRFERFLADAGQTAQIVLANLDRAADLIRSFKQVAVDQSTESARPIELKSYLETSVASLKPELKAGRHRVEIDCPDDIVIETYPGLIAQILSNLVLNSARHGFGTDISGGEIRIDCAEDGDSVTVSYSDNGKGMAPDVLKNAFEPFFTTARKEGGSGLGLSIVYNLVTHKLQGKLTCESTPGQGVRFVISLPRQGVEPTAA